jgi:hypothetical protein
MVSSFFLFLFSGHVNICLSKVILDMKDYVKSMLPLVSCSERIFGY